MESNIWDSFLKNVPKLTQEEKDLCEGPITLAECNTALKQMKKSKSPGCDGLPAEFYNKFFHLIGEHLVVAYNKNIAQLSPSQRLSFITLLCKDPNKSEEIGNWRPISLLNTDYKILSKVLTNRLKNIAKSIIGPEQTCGIAGRSIFDNLHLLRNVYDYCRQRGIPCVAICFDQAKAFDSLDHGYLLYVLSTMGFGPSFIHWVSLLYTDIYSCVLVNGFLTSPFIVSRSVRQGCGFSPLLYALCIQPLSILIRQSLIFRGIPLPTSPPSEVRISMYADDTTVLASDTSSVNNAIDCFNTFCRASGAKLNLAKCEACIFSGRPDLSGWPSWLKIVDAVKICGIYFGARASLLMEDKLKQKITSSLKTFGSRHLTLLGKVILINTLVLSKLWYTATCTIISDPFFRWLDGAIFSFI